MGFFARIKSLFRKKPPVLGLALGSGGAKGMAHLGILKAFEEEGITFGVITGASIGSIVGALLAKGFTSADMTGIVENLNRKEFARNLRPFADLSFLETYLGQYLEGNIEDLPIPFAAWATDGETNNGVLLDRGKTARALTASAAIPPFFRGVEWEGRKLYDGAFSNAVPADVCRNMGADLVIGVDLAAFLKPEAEKGAISRLIGSAIGALGALSQVRYTEDARTRGYDAADIMLRPDLHDYTATDVNQTAMDAMYEIGYREARAHMAEIKAAIQAAGKKRRAKK